MITDDFAMLFHWECWGFICECSGQWWILANCQLKRGDFPCTFCKEFLAIRHQAREISRLQWFSFSTLLRISDSTKLCPSIIRFDQGDSAPVVCTFILSISHSVINSSLTSSPPLSVKNLSTVPYRATQYFDGKITVADKLVAWSIVWGP